MLGDNLVIGVSGLTNLGLKVDFGQSIASKGKFGLIWKAYGFFVYQQEEWVDHL